MSFYEVWLSGYGFIIGMMTIVWLISVVTVNVSIIDIFWGFGFVLLAWIYYVLTDGYVDRKLIMTTLVTVWGLRLTLHLSKRNIGKGEDYRYQQFRKKYGENSYWWKSYFQAFLLQGTIMTLISAPLLFADYSPQPAQLGLLDAVGIFIWGIGFLFESLGDWQLAKFKANSDNAGKVLRTGLWKYTRHPNYFGDALVWWGIYFIALSTPNGIFSIFSPILMTFLLMRISGVALLEKSLRKNKPEYSDYIKCTSAFIPMPPKC